MINVLLEDVESEIIDKKLKEGISGISFLLDVAGEITDAEMKGLTQIVEFSLKEVTNETYSEFTTEALAEDKEVFETKYSVDINTVRKMLFKTFVVRAKDSGDKLAMALAINNRIRNYKAV